MNGRILSALVSSLTVVLSSALLHAQSAPAPGPVVSNLPPVITVLASDPNAAEDGLDPATIEVSRTGPTEAPLTIYYTLGGTARNGRDYQMLPGVLTIPAGTNAANVTITPLADVDSLAETNDTVVLQVHPAIDFILRTSPYAIGWPSNAVATIAESTVPRTNQPPVLRLVSPATGAGFIAPATIPLVVQARDPDGMVTNVEFFAGATILGIVTNSAAQDRSRSLFSLTWSNVTAGTYSLTAKATDNSGASTVSTPVSIRVLAQADVPTITVTATDAAASELGPDVGTFTVTRTGDTSAALAAYYTLGGTARNGVDYQRLPGIVNFAAGSSSTNITVVPIADLDLTAHTNDTVVLQLRPLVDLRPGLVGLYQLGSPSNAVVTITESANAFPVVTVAATDAHASEDGPDAAVFQVTRAGNTGTDLRVFYALGGTARNGRDYQMLPGYVTIPAGAASTNISVVPILDIDSTPETNETVVLQLRTGRDFFPAGGAYALGWPSNAVATIAESTAPRTNQPPVVRLVSPQDGAGFVAPAQLTLVAQARDVDGTVTNVEFFAGTSSLGSVTNSAPGYRRDFFALGWTNVAVGSYVLTAKATDNSGASSTSGPVHIVVTQTALPVVSILATDPLAWTGTNTLGQTNAATLAVRRTGPTNTDLVVYYTVSGTASNGVDYVKLPGSVIIPTGSRAASIRIDPLQSTRTNAVANVILTVEPPPVSGQNPPAYLVGRVNRAAALIVDRASALGSGGMHQGVFYMPVPAPANAPYRLERSSNLLDWEAIGSSPTGQGTVPVVDPNALNSPWFFYRVVPESGESQN